MEGSELAPFLPAVEMGSLRMLFLYSTHIMPHLAIQEGLCTLFCLGFIAKIAFFLFFCRTSLGTEDFLLDHKKMLTLGGILDAEKILLATKGRQYTYVRLRITNLVSQYFEQ
jgi:hypothetical protein